MIEVDCESNDQREITHTITKSDDFNYINFTKDSLAVKNHDDPFKIEIEKKESEIIYKRAGIDNGIYISYHFKIIDGCWFLTFIKDEST